MAANVARLYIENDRARAERHRKFYAGQPGIEVAIHTASFSLLPNGRRHPHQCRVPRFVLTKTERRLQAHSQTIAGCVDFAELHKLVEATIRPITGIGELAVYDIAERIGAYLGLEPQVVYLHAGSRLGARALGLGGRTLAIGQLPKALHQLRAREIEDCLCIYRDALSGVRTRRQSRCAQPRAKRRSSQRSGVC